MTRRETKSRKNYILYRTFSFCLLNITGAMPSTAFVIRDEVAILNANSSLSDEHFWFILLLVDVRVAWSVKMCTRLMLTQRQNTKSVGNTFDCHSSYLLHGGVDEWRDTPAQWQMNDDNAHCQISDSNISFFYPFLLLYSRLCQFRLLLIAARHLIASSPLENLLISRSCMRRVKYFRWFMTFCLKSQ